MELDWNLPLLLLQRHLKSKCIRSVDWLDTIVTVTKGQSFRGPLHERMGGMQFVISNIV